LALSRGGACVAGLHVAVGRRVGCEGGYQQRCLSKVLLGALKAGGRVGGALALGAGLDGGALALCWSWRVDISAGPAFAL
jgi:hypothetical protein